MRRFPKTTVEYCLREGGIKLSGLDCVAFYEKPFLKFDRICTAVWLTRRGS
jgi:carbamoyltransferase